MKKIFFSNLFFLTLNFSFGQKYYSTDIIKKADSIIIAAVGQKIFEDHYKFDSSSYFESKTSFNDKYRKRLTKIRKTRGEIKSINIRYIFYIKKFEQPSIWTSLIFDSNLNLKKPIDTSFIPKFILRGTRNEFLTKDDVLEIARYKFGKKIINPIEAELTYDYNKEKYIWLLTNRWKIYKDEIYKEIELLYIDATNGNIINFYPKALEGPLH